MCGLYFLRILSIGSSCSLERFLGFFLPFRSAFLRFGLLLEGLFEQIYLVFLLDDLFIQHLGSRFQALHALIGLAELSRNELHLAVEYL